MYTDACGVCTQLGERTLSVCTQVTIIRCFIKQPTSIERYWTQYEQIRASV